MGGNLDLLDPDFNLEGFGDHPKIDDPNVMDSWAEIEDKKRELQRKN